MLLPEHLFTMLQNDAYCSICLKLSVDIYEMHRVRPSVPVTVCTQNGELLLLLVTLLDPVANIHIMALVCSSHADTCDMSFLGFHFLFESNYESEPSPQNLVILTKKKEK